MKVVIIDDEKKARTLLSILLEENCPEIKLIQTASNLLEGVALIQETQPDIVFLDIEMPQHSGLQIFEYVNPEQIDFDLIFTTAYSAYAIQAFEMNAVDYLLKPLRVQQIVNAVQKVIKNRGKYALNDHLQELKNSLELAQFSKIAFPLNDGLLFVSLDEIIFLAADRMYTQVYTVNDGNFIVSKPLKFFIDTLSPIKTFYKPHRSYLINLKHIKKYVNKDKGYILMDNNEEVAISKEKKKELLDIFLNG